MSSKTGFYLYDIFLQHKRFALNFLLSERALSSLVIEPMASFFNDIALQPPNAVLGLALQCNQDKASEKIDLVIGAYRGDDGKLLVLDCVREAEEFVYKANAGHEYLNQGRSH